jgi:hypothetical protein
MEVNQRILEKDFWVSQVLRAIFAEHGGQVLLKGGTSLSKCWGIIERFSEDIDLLLVTEPGDVTGELLDALTDLAGEVCGHPAVVGQTAPGYARVVSVKYLMAPNTPRYAGLRQDIRPEPGVRGGPKPEHAVKIAPMLAAGLGEAASEFDDLQPFPVGALHPARTLVEKLFAVDEMAVRLLTDSYAEPGSTQFRHFYDIHFLLDEVRSPAVELLTEGSSYREIAEDCAEVATRFFADSDVESATRRRSAGEFHVSPTFSDEALIERLSPAFDRTVAELCFPGAPRPSLAEVCAHVRSLSWL